jgi:hypothetical protein
MTERLTLPFPRGKSSAEDHSHLVGTVYTFLDTQFNTNREIKIKLVKNSSTIALAPRKLVRWKTSGDYQTEVDGYTRLEAEHAAGAVDDLIPSGTTVPVSSYFYIVTEGPALCQLPETASEAGPVDATVGAKMVAASAAASTAVTDAGAVRTRNATYGATGTALGNNVEHAVGRAATARATTQTGSAILVILGS